MRALTERHRQHQLAIRAQLLHRLLAVWPLLDSTNLDGTFPTWLAAAVPLVQDARAASAGAAAVYIRHLRAEENVPGTVRPVLAAAAPVEQVAASLSATSLASIRTAFGAGQNAVQAMSTGYVTSGGAASRIALQGGQSTVIDTVRADRYAKGWKRVTGGSPCAFCAVLASRGGVYKESTADFRSHDHCSCAAEPVYSGSLAPTGQAAEWARLYDQRAAGTRHQMTEFRRAYEGRVTS